MTKVLHTMLKAASFDPLSMLRVFPDHLLPAYRTGDLQVSFSSIIHSAMHVNTRDDESIVN